MPWKVCVRTYDLYFPDFKYAIILKKTYNSFTYHYKKTRTIIIKSIAAKSKYEIRTNKRCTAMILYVIRDQNKIHNVGDEAHFNGQTDGRTDQYK